MKYCCVTNNGVSVCVCKHKPCINIKEAQEMLKAIIEQTNILPLKTNLQKVLQKLEVK